MDVLGGVKAISLIRRHLDPDLVALLQLQHGTTGRLVHVAFLVLVVGVGSRHIVLVQRHPQAGALYMHVVCKVVDTRQGSGEHACGGAVGVLPVVQGPVKFDWHG